MRRARVGRMCVVPDCLSAYYPGCGIRFHVFPKDIKKRNSWIKRLNLSPADYHQDTMLCYLHFHFSDYINNNPKNKLKSFALPHVSKNRRQSDSCDSDVESIDVEKALEKLKEVSSSSNIDSSDNNLEDLTLTSSDEERKVKKKVKKKTAPKKFTLKSVNNELVVVKKEENEEIDEKDQENEGEQKFCEVFVQNPDITEEEDLENVLMHVCRTCLATGCKMYSIRQYNLEQTYLLLTGISSDMLDETKMPQMLCFECVQRLQNYIEFSTKSLTAWSLLMELMEEKKLTVENLKNINREQNLLTSKIAIKVYEPNYFDIQVEEYDESDHKNTIEDANENPKEVMELELDNDSRNFDIKDDTNISNEEFKVETKEISHWGEQKGNIVIKTPKKFHPSENGHPYDKLQFDENLHLNENLHLSENLHLNENLHPSDDEDNISDNSVTPRNSRNKLSEKYWKEYNKLFIITTMTPEDQKAEIEKRKLTRTYQNAVFKCDKCYRAYNFEAPYKEHMKRHTNECGEFICDVCQTHFMTRFALSTHIRSRHDTFIQCRLCPFKSAWKSAANSHKSFHDGKLYKCKKCPKSYAKSTTYRVHLQREHPEDAVCHLCGDSYTGIRGLEKHLRTAHTREPLQIPPTKTRSHFHWQSVRRNETASSAYTIVSFKTTLPEDAPYCPTCDIRFRDDAALGTHLNVSPCHGNVPKMPHKAPRRCLPDDRRKIYHGNRKVTDPITCEQCGCECPNLRQYIRHFADAHPDRNRTQYSPALRTFMCELCGKIFQNITILNEHRVSHSGLRPYACERCGDTFKTKHALRIHSANHTQSRRCTLCGNTYATVGGLMRHILIHTGKPYACEPCNKRFCTPSSKRAHIEHYHKGVPWPKKRPKGEPRLRHRGGKFQSDADMAADVETNVPTPSANVVTQYVEE